MLSTLALSVLLLPGLATSATADGEPPDAPLFKEVTCEGTYAKHLQGVCTDGAQGFFWSFTDQLLKTDRDGKILAQIPVGDHHGDLCYADGKVYVAVNFGKFNQPEGAADSWVYVYNADDLKEVARHRVPEVVHGAGGIASRDGRFFVVGGLPEGVKENYIYEHDSSFRFQRRHVLPSGTTLMGIQTAEHADGRWWFGCYGKPTILLVADKAFRDVQRFEFDASLGIIGLGRGRFLVADAPARVGGRHLGVLRPARATTAGGLEFVRP